MPGCPVRRRVVDFRFGRVILYTRAQRKLKTIKIVADPVAVIGINQVGVNGPFFIEYMVPAQISHPVAPIKFDFKSVSGKRKNILPNVTREGDFVFLAGCPRNFCVQILKIVIRNGVKLGLAILRFIVHPGEDIKISSPYAK